MSKSMCPACRGSKKVMKLGYMTGDCETCDGKGHVANLPPTVEKEKAEVLEAIDKESSKSEEPTNLSEAVEKDLKHANAKKKTRR